jgi:hypothetical protein
MPYISNERREKFEPGLTLLSGKIQSLGELNYVITTLCLDWLGGKQSAWGDLYDDYASVEGVLGHVAKEFYRRKTVLFEEKKIGENGDVYR